MDLKGTTTSTKHRVAAFKPVKKTRPISSKTGEGGGREKKATSTLSENVKKVTEIECGSYYQHVTELRIVKREISDWTEKQ